MLTVKQKGSTVKMESFLKKASQLDLRPLLHKYGKLGVQALAEHTTVDTGATASGWYYTISKNKVTWRNSNINNGVVIVLLIIYGHATKNGGFVQGNNFVNPALASIFEEFAKEVTKEVQKL